MGSIYQLIFFLGIALLAIVITVFVLAVSLLGRAVRLSAEEQTEAEERRKQDTENEIKKIQEKLDQAKAQGRLDVEDLTKNLQDLESKETKHKWKLRWIKIKPKLLTATWGALVPGAFFLISVIFSALALYLQGGASTATLYMSIALIALGIGIGFVCLTLKVIEGVAITSEETGLVRETEVFKSALREIEEEKKPWLVLDFVGESLPLHIKTDVEAAIGFTLDVTQGEIARRPIVYFFAPPGFDFPRTGTWVQREDAGQVAGYITTRVDFQECRKGMRQPGEVYIKAPSEEGTYPLWYRLTCEGFASDLIEFEVVVE